MGKLLMVSLCHRTTISAETQMKLYAASLTVLCGLFQADIKNISPGDYYSSYYHIKYVSDL